LGCGCGQGKSDARRPGQSKFTIIIPQDCHAPSWEPVLYHFAQFN
jgi:hypothetical protein